VPQLEVNLPPAQEDVPQMAVALIRAVMAAADRGQDEMTVLVVGGEPAAVIAPYGHHRQPGAAAEIRFDQAAPPEARLVLADTWGGSIRMSIGEFRQLAQAGTSSRFEAMAQIAQSWGPVPGTGHPRGAAPDQDRDLSGARPDVADEVSGPFGIIPREKDSAVTGRMGQRAGAGAASFRCGACGELAAVVKAVPAGCPADLGPPLGVQSQDRDGVVVDYFGGTGWIGADAAVYQVVRGILEGQAPDPAALRELGWELAPFWCPDCAQAYCYPDWHARARDGAGPGGGKTGRCPRGHEHQTDY
jgi:hypothetical protein